ERVVQHHDVAWPGGAELIDEFVHDQPVVVFERRRHTEAVHPCDLKTERDDERRVNGGGEQSSRAGGDLLSEPAPHAESRRKLVYRRRHDRALIGRKLVRQGGSLSWLQSNFVHNAYSGYHQERFWFARQGAPRFTPMHVAVVRERRLSSDVGAP